MFQAQTKWTHEKLRAPTHDANFNVTDMPTYVGFQSASSLTSAASYKRFAVPGSLLMLAILAAVMSRDWFKQICTCLKTLTLIRLRICQGGFPPQGAHKHGALLAQSH